MEKENSDEKGEFKGINFLTGRKIYLTPEEEKVLKKQWKQWIPMLWILGGLFLLWCVMMIFWPA